jgi:hypothetical protein
MVLDLSEVQKYFSRFLQKQALPVVSVSSPTTVGYFIDDVSEAVL